MTNDQKIKNKKLTLGVFRHILKLLRNMNGNVHDISLFKISLKVSGGFAHFEVLIEL
jgi:hypothetical protein